MLLALKYKTEKNDPPCLHYVQKDRELTKLMGEEWVTWVIPKKNENWMGDFC